MLKIIRRVNGGYVSTDYLNQESVFTSLEALFEHILLVFEGRSKTFTGKHFGKISIERNIKERSTILPNGNSFTLSGITYTKEAELSDDIKLYNTYEEIEFVENTKPKRGSIDSSDEWMDG